MKNHRLILPILLLPALLFLLAPQSLHAGSATWNLNPATGDWNTASNWMPNTVPNGSTDIATFGVSNTTAVSLSSPTTVAGIAFGSGASGFSITASPSLSLTIAGAGMTNNSGHAQKFDCPTDANGNFGSIIFNGNASAGYLCNYSTEPGRLSGVSGGLVQFVNDSNVGQPTVTNLGSQISGTLGVLGGETDFYASNAGNGTFIAAGAGPGGKNGGRIAFFTTSSAGTATFKALAGRDSAAGGGINFHDESSAEQGNFILAGASAQFATSGAVNFEDTATAANGLFIIHQASPDSELGFPGSVTFTSNSSAGNATFIADGDPFLPGAAAFINFEDDSLGGTARIELPGGQLFCTNHNAPGLTIGSLEGSGDVYLGTNLAIGANNLSTTFSGTIIGASGAGSITKVGTKKFTLSGSNTYGQGTTVAEGILEVANTTGSATGPGAVEVNGGTLGGSGVIAGAVSLNFGATLAPATNTTKQATLTIQSSLTFNSGSTYTCTFKTKEGQLRTDEVVAKGVTINGATFNLSGVVQGTVNPGLVLTVISNTGAIPITGTFANLPDGAILTVGGNNFQASYEGGDGNDLTLTVVP